MISFFHFRTISHTLKSDLNVEPSMTSPVFIKEQTFHAFGHHALIKSTKQLLGIGIGFQNDNGFFSEDLVYPPQKATNNKVVEKGKSLYDF